MRRGMVIDLKRCIGCYGCQAACKAENGTPPGIFWARCVRMEMGEYPARRSFLPVLCMHCQEPPCLEVCPTGATQKRDDGIVFIDADQCVGCGACMQACPYQARYFNDKIREYFPGQGFTPYDEWAAQKHPTGVVEKCDFCRERLEQGQEPACVANCMAKARYFGDLDDPQSEVSRLIREKAGYQLRSELGAAPSVYYLAP